MQAHPGHVLSVATQSGTAGVFAADLSICKVSRVGGGWRDRGAAHRITGGKSSRSNWSVQDGLGAPAGLTAGMRHGALGHWAGGVERGDGPLESIGLGGGAINSTGTKSVEVLEGPWDRIAPSMVCKFWVCKFWGAEYEVETGLESAKCAGRHPEGTKWRATARWLSTFCIL